VFVGVKVLVGVLVAVAAPVVAVEGTAVPMATSRNTIREDRELNGIEGMFTNGTMTLNVVLTPTTTRSPFRMAVAGGQLVYIVLNVPVSEL
jgi:hypothetical protein